MNRVHPRSRGAAAHLRGLIVAAGGPSPLTRGSRHGGTEQAGQGGSIPAHAGQPQGHCLGQGDAGVHPRSRGAALAQTDRDSVLQGPSPLTRGSQTIDPLGHMEYGSIPAHAGQPASMSGWKQRTWVHPRSRGAASPAPAASTIFMGPSPLTRGSPSRRQMRLNFYGSIPAHAGQPIPGCPTSADPWVHPRSRGAAGIDGHAHHVAKGPSPLTRGSLAMTKAPQAEIGSIPAHAGQPLRYRPRGPWRWVHPRSRGAASPPLRLSSNSLGPSPLTRGSHAATEPLYQ